MEALGYAKARLLGWRDGYPDYGAYRTLVRQEGLSAEAIRDLRRRKARRLAAACLRHVPYYRDLMRAAGLDPATIQGPEEFAVLPILDKPIVRAHAADMLSRDVLPDDYQAHTTGGSTGMPLNFFRGRDYDALANAGTTMRALRRLGWRPGDRLARVWAPPPEPPPPRGAFGRLRRRARRWLDTSIMLSVYDASPAAMEEWIGRLRAFRPRFLYGYAGNLVLFATYLRERAARIEGIAAVASTAEALFPEQRHILREAFPGARIADIYGSREIPGIAAECARGTLHLNWDLVHVDFEPQGEGRESRLVVTALDNDVFPFIRYDIGDGGSPADVACGCGLTFPAMSFGVRKIVDAFISPEGRIVSGHFFSYMMYHVRGVHAYQFRQRSADDIVLFVVPSESFDSAVRAHLETFQERIHRGFSPKARFSIRLVDAIPLTPLGKHRYVVSDLSHPLLRAAGARQGESVAG